MIIENQDVSQSAGQIELDMSTLNDTAPGFVHIDIKGGHGAFAMVVWQMEDDRLFGRNSPECEAQARRMVASWNACRHISTESLEENGAVGFEQIVELRNIYERAMKTMPNAEGRTA